MNAGLPPWLEIVTSALLVLSGVVVLISATGFLRMPDFFLRLHPPALAYTLGSWSVTLAATLYLCAAESKVALHPLLIPCILAVTVPVTTLLLARVALFRRRVGGAADTPPPLSPPQSS